MSKTKNCHYIQRVYLMSWKKANSNYNINVYDKEKKQIVKNGLNIKNNFFIKDLYNYKLFDDSQATKYEKEIRADIIKKISEFETDNDVEIYYNGKQLKYFEDNNYIFITQVDNIEFKKKSTNIMCCNKEKKGYISELKKIKSTFIEDSLNKNVEDNWNKVLDLLKKDCTNFEDNPNLKSITIESTYINWLKNMAKLMIYRIPNTPGYKTHNNRIESACSAMKSILAKPIYSDETADNETYIQKMCAPVDNFPSYYLKKNVYDILNGNSVYASDFFKDSLIYEIFIIKDETDLEFYTSDVPCFVVNNKFEASNKNNAIYFPITDKILLRMKRNRQLVDKINFYKAYNDDVRYFNNLIYNNANKYIIFKGQWR